MPPFGDVIMSLRDVQKLIHHTATPILTSINPTVYRGQQIAITGPSGSGKSTLLSILGVLDLPTSAQYHLINRPVLNIGGRERTRLRNSLFEFIFQRLHLLSSLSTVENVALPPIV